MARLADIQLSVAELDVFAKNHGPLFPEYRKITEQAMGLMDIGFGMSERTRTRRIRDLLIVWYQSAANTFRELHGDESAIKDGLVFTDRVIEIAAQYDAEYLIERIRRGEFSDIVATMGGKS